MEDGIQKKVIFLKNIFNQILFYQQLKEKECS